LNADKNTSEPPANAGGFLNGKRETVVLGQYGNGGISLAEVRERLTDARRMVELAASEMRNGGTRMEIIG
jgi:hypothetical protein